MFIAKLIKKIVPLLIVSLALTSLVQAAPWKFGVMGDTQWTCPNDPARQNPHSVPISIIDQINRQFIQAGVKFVIQVGDLTDKGTNTAETTRAKAAQALYDANIGFFPMRGNHETYGTKDYAVGVFRANYPQTRGISAVFGAANFSSPALVSAAGADLNGLSYSFDYGDPCNNARFVIIDDWAIPGKVIKIPGLAGIEYGFSFGDQQDWLSSRLDKKTRGTEHVFVFSHQPLIAESHQDCPFIGYTNANPDMQNAFFASLQNNGVKYYICGHDHLYKHSAITSPDGKSGIEQIICTSCSSKFYTPVPAGDPNWFGQKAREKIFSRDLYHVGFCIFTVDGPKVTVEYYSDKHGRWQSDSDFPSGRSDVNNQITPAFQFDINDTFTYTLSD